MTEDDAFVQFSSRNSPILFSTSFGVDKPIMPTSDKEPFVTVILILELSFENEPTHLFVIWLVLSLSHGRL